MPISVQQTQDLIRRAVARSRETRADSPPLPSNEAGMATGPRPGHRSFSRTQKTLDFLQQVDPDYVDPAVQLDEDIYRFVWQRGEELLSHAQPITHQFIYQVETELASCDTTYAPGRYLSLIRLAADTEQTSRTLVTTSEKGAFHRLRRRLQLSDSMGEHYDLGVVTKAVDILMQENPYMSRGIGDLMRVLARATHSPLIGQLNEASPLYLACLLRIIEIASQFNRREPGVYEFQVTPMDVFLGAQAVLANRSLRYPSLEMIMELALSESGLYRGDLQDWIEHVALFGPELTLQIPDALCREGFRVQGYSLTALQLMVAGGRRLLETTDKAKRDAIFRTLADGLVHKIQRQDLHKDYEVRDLLQGFQGLMDGETRSARQISESRRRQRFDYLDAVRKSGDLVRQIQSGRSEPADEEAVASKQGISAPVLAWVEEDESDPEIQTISEADFEGERRAVKRSFRLEDSDTRLGDWDHILAHIRTTLPKRSPTVKAVVALTGKARALDSCMTWGTTPGGARCVTRVLRLAWEKTSGGHITLSDREMSDLELLLADAGPAFASALEGLLIHLYDGRTHLADTTLSLPDRGVEGAGTDWQLVEVVYRLILLAGEISSSAGANAGEKPVFIDPLRTLGILLSICTENGMEIPDEGPKRMEFLHRALKRLPPEWKAAIADNAREFVHSDRNPKHMYLVPDLGDYPLRLEWYRGFERGCMEELSMACEKAGDAEEMDENLCRLLHELNSFVDQVTLHLEKTKGRLVQDGLYRLSQTWIRQREG